MPRMSLWEYQKALDRHAKKMLERAMANEELMQATRERVREWRPASVAKKVFLPAKFMRRHVGGQVRSRVRSSRRRTSTRAV